MREEAIKILEAFQENPVTITITVITSIITAMILSEMGLTTDMVIGGVAVSLADAVLWYTKWIIRTIERVVVDFTPKLIVATEEGFAKVREPSIIHDFSIPKIGH